MHAAVFELASPGPVRYLASVPSPDAALTPRELRVLALLADGYRTSEIARELAYSERTIKHAIATMTSRLHLRNRTQAVAFAVRQGLI